MNDTQDIFDDEFDVLVVGYGFAGAAAAIAAADGGKKVLLVEKMPDPGGISICSGGSARSAYAFDDALAYLTASNAGRTPNDVLSVIAQGMVDIPKYLETLAAACGLRITPSLTGNRKRGGNYPLPGWETFYHTHIDLIPDWDARDAYPQVAGMPGGARLFHVMQKNVEMREIDVWLEAPAQQIISRNTGNDVEILGLVVAAPSGTRRVRARCGVVLACGGFECNEEMKQQYWQMTPVLAAMARQNSGDGLRMAQSVGAQLWHMWHFHGSYGFNPPDDVFPYAVRMKRLPDWLPTEDTTARAAMCWILVDQTGRRFMNEMPPYTQDTAARPLELYDPMTQTFPRIPSHMICDEEGRKMYPLGMPCYNERGIDFVWSADNSDEIESGMLKRADSVKELASIIGADEAVLEATLDHWNACCAREEDPEFGRLPGSFVPIRTPPFYTGEIWPVVSNTQGGPVHNARQQIINADGQPISRLYAAGELGSAFGHLYMSGSNIAECFITGEVAGREAASLPAWRA
jgi:succinate dehydrogenase/fumarate reductase flavoprotein subunit